MAATPHPDRPSDGWARQLDPRPPVTARRLLLAVAGVAALSLVSVVSLVASIAAIWCDLDDTSCSPNTTLSLVLALVALIAFLGTSTVAGHLVERWWAWMAPVWIVLGLLVMSTLGGLMA